MVCRIEFTIWKVVELSSPVDISSMKSARPGVTSISAAGTISSVNELDHREVIPSNLILNSQGSLPVVTRFFWPPEMPLNILFPTIVSAQISNPKTWNLSDVK
jgi:hypothetical protein